MVQGVLGEEGAHTVHQPHQVQHRQVDQQVYQRWPVSQKAKVFYFSLQYKTGQPSDNLKEFDNA